MGAKKITSMLAAFESQTMHERAAELLGDGWKSALDGMSKEEIAGRFLALSLPEIFSEQREESPATPGRTIPGAAGHGSSTASGERRVIAFNRRETPLEVTRPAAVVAPASDSSRHAREFAKKPFAGKKAFAPKPFGGGKAFRDDKPYGKREFTKKPYEKKSFGGDKPFAKKKSYGKKSFEKPSYSGGFFKKGSSYAKKPKGSVRT
jgi:hypothetical protein